MTRRIGIVLVVTGVLLPLLPLLVWSVSGQWQFPDLAPRTLSLRGFEPLLDPHADVARGLLTSTGIAVAVSLLACLIGFPAGRAVGLYRFHGRRLVQFLLLAPVIVPGLATTLGLQVFFIRSGLADSVTGVVLVQLMPTVPYVATVLGGAFANLDIAYETQARALGAGPVRTLAFVTLPLLRPAIVVSAVFAFLISWSEYILTLLVGGGQVKTLPLLLFAAIGSSDTTAAAALAVLMIVPPLILLTITARTVSASSVASIGLARL